VWPLQQLLLSIFLNSRNSWSESQIDDLESQHRDLRFKYQESPTLAEAIDTCDDTTSFKTAWSIVGSGRFDVLKDFCGGIATVFADTATVEADLSNISWEKDDFRKSLTDLSVEGILQCKQYDLLSSLV